MYRTHQSDAIFFCRNVVRVVISGCADTAVNCTEGSYVENFLCTNTVYKLSTIKESYKSFPSSHVVYTSYMAIVCVKYILLRLRKRLRKLRIFLLKTFVIWTTVVTLSTIYDHQHFWMDVIAGSIFAAIFAKYVFFLVKIDRR